MLIDEWNDGHPQTASDAAERAILAIFLVDPGARLEAFGNVEERHFRQKMLGKLYAASQAQKKCDLVSLAHRMETDGVPAPGGSWPVALSRLADENWQWDPESTKDYCRIVREAASLRALAEMKRGRSR